MHCARIQRLMRVLVGAMHRVPTVSHQKEVEYVIRSDSHTSAA